MSKTTTLINSSSGSRTYQPPPSHHQTTIMPVLTPRSRLRIMDNDVSSPHSDNDPLISTRSSSGGGSSRFSSALNYNNNIIEEEIGEYLDTDSSSNSKLGLVDPSSHGSFPANFEEDEEEIQDETIDTNANMMDQVIPSDSYEELQQQQMETDNDNQQTGSPIQLSPDHSSPPTFDSDHHHQLVKLQPSSSSPRHQSLPINQQDGDEQSSLENTITTPKKTNSFKKRFPLPVNQPVFSPRKNRLIKHFSEYYFHPEFSDYSSCNSQLVSPKEVNSFLNHHRNELTTHLDHQDNNVETTQGNSAITTTATTASASSAVNGANHHLTQRQKNLLQSIQVAKAIKESNNSSTTNNTIVNPEPSSTTNCSEVSGIGNSKRLYIKEKLLLAQQLLLAEKQDESTTTATTTLTSSRSEGGVNYSVEDWLTFQKSHQQDQNNNEDNIEEGGIFEFTQVTDLSPTTESTAEEEENTNMTSSTNNSLAPSSFHLIKKSSTRAMQLITTTDASIVGRSASPTGLFANLPPILKPLQLSQTSSNQLEKKHYQLHQLPNQQQHQQVRKQQPQMRNSLQQFQSTTTNKPISLHTVPKPSKSQQLVPSAKTTSPIQPIIPMTSQSISPLLIPNSNSTQQQPAAAVINDEVKPVRRKKVPQIKIPQDKVQQVYPSSSSSPPIHHHHQPLKSPSHHKQQAGYELAADSVFVVVSGDVLNEIRERNEKTERRKPYEIVYFDKSLSRVKQVVPCGAFSIFVVESNKEHERVFIMYKENTLLHPTKKVENVYNKYFTFCNPTTFHPQLREIDFKTMIRNEMYKNPSNLDPYVLEDPKSLELNEVYGTQDAFMLQMRNNFCILVHFAETAEKVKISFFEEYAGGSIDWIETNPCSNTLLLYGHARGRTNYLLDIMILDPEPRRRKLILPPQISQNDIRIIRVGLLRILIVTNDNQLYIHRSEKKGSETTENFELFDKVWEAPIRQVRCGGYHNVVLLQNGTIYTWGFNNHYQCGIYENVKNKIPMISLTCLPLPKSIDGDITDIQASYLTTSVITTNGVWTIGDMTAKLNNYVKSTDALRYHTIPFSKFNFLLNAMWSSGDHLVLFNHSENHEGMQGYFSKNLSKMLHIESSSSGSSSGQDEKSSNR